METSEPVNGIGSPSEAVSSRRFRALASLSLLVGLFMIPSLLESSESEPTFEIRGKQSPAVSTTASPTLGPTAKPNKFKAIKDVPANPKKGLSEHLKATNTSSVTSVCSDCSNFGRHVQEPRQALVKNLSMNHNAHIFAFPKSANHKHGQRPLLCVPQKNGNKQFGGLVYAAWNKKPAITGEGVDHDMSHWQKHLLRQGFRADRGSHVYFVTRNPYSRILSLYLQKVVNACISTGQKGCNEKGWHNIKPDTNFKTFLKKVEKMVEQKGSLCDANHHLCQQVESCLTTTHVAKEVTMLRIEEQSCWFPCFVKQIRVKSKLLEHGWTKFSGRSCYYTATGNCSDMLRPIAPDKVGVATGNVHATGASNRLAEHYDAESAAIVTRLYADDFRILGYDVWDGVTPM